MALTEEQKNKMREGLEKLKPDELIDLNIALNEKLDEEQTTARTERQKALYDFLHPKRDEATKGERKEEERNEDEKPDPYFERIALKFKSR